MSAVSDSMKKGPRSSSLVGTGGAGGWANAVKDSQAKAATLAALRLLRRKVRRTLPTEIVCFGNGPFPFSRDSA